MTSRSETWSEVPTFCLLCQTWFFEDAGVAFQKILAGKANVCIKCDPDAEERPYVATGKGLFV